MVLVKNHVGLLVLLHVTNTLPETNIAPENGGLED